MLKYNASKALLTNCHRAAVLPTCTGPKLNMRGDKYSKLLVRILHPQESTMVHDRIQKEPKVMVSSQSTQEKSLVAIETDASGALICW